MGIPLRLRIARHTELLILLAILFILSGLLLGTYWSVRAPRAAGLVAAPSAPMTISQASVRATAMTGRMMDCWASAQAQPGEWSGGAYVCRPVGRSQTELEPRGVIVRPLVVCEDGACALVLTPPRTD